MTAEIVQFIPKSNPELTEAIDFARSINGGAKCAEQDCTMDDSGFCSGAGCLLALNPIGPHTPRSESK